MKIFVSKYFPLFWFAVIAIVAWLAWGLELAHAQDEFDDDILTADELDAEDDYDYERHMEMDDEWILVEQRVEEQQNTIDSLEQRELELRRELELLREEAAAKAAADEARRIALGEALKSYKVTKENDT